MGHTSCLGDQKFDPTKPKRAPPNSQSSLRRQKTLQTCRDGDTKRLATSTSEGWHQLCLFVDRKGHFYTQSSLPLTEKERNFILKDAIPKFRKALQKRMDMAPIPFGREADAAFDNGPPMMKCQPIGCSPSTASDSTMTDARIFKAPRKRRRASSEGNSVCLQDDHSSHWGERPGSISAIADPSHLFAIEVKDAPKLREYLYDAFTAFQQINCRTLCKSWIRTIEPKKQVNHPYNGNLKMKGSQKLSAHDLAVQRDSDPEETKPKWWPSKEECPHKEPDHIKKEQRLALLCHILMNTLRLHDCSTVDLRTAIDSDKAKIKPPEKADILADVWKIGEAIEKFNDGQIDGSTKVFVRARKEEARMIRGGGRLRKPRDAQEESEDGECSEGRDEGLETGQTLDHATSSALPCSALYITQEPTTRAPPHAHLEDAAYVDGSSPHHLEPSHKSSYHNHQPEYPIPLEVSRNLGDHPPQGPSVSVFGGNVFPYTNMQDIRHHGNLFPPEQQPTAGPWAISAPHNLYPMHYTGEPSQPPVMNPAGGEHLFSPYSYANHQRQQYRNDIPGYSVDNNAQFAPRVEDNELRLPRVNTCSLPSLSAERFQDPPNNPPTPI